MKTDPKFEYIPRFLSAQESTELFAALEKQKGFVLEIGQCRGAKPSHATVQWGPRQAYLSCVPKPYRIKSSGDVPDFLRGIKTRLETKYNCYFDSIQVNKHFDHNATVLSHTDSPPGHICMISLGAERDFVLAHIYHKPMTTVHLTDGSLLTFFPKDQWRMCHSMPRSKVPCGPRYALLFRYITDALVQEGSIDKHPTAVRKKRNQDRGAEYDAVQAAFHVGGYDAVKECLRVKPWVDAQEKSVLQPPQAVAEYGRSKSMDRRLETQGKPRS